MKKKISIYVLLLSLISLMGCDKFLDDTLILNVETASTAFRTEADADQAVTAIYATIRTRDGLNGRMAHVLFDISTSDFKIIREPNKVNNYTFNTSSDDVAFTTFWTMSYGNIGRCNSALDVLPLTNAPEEKLSRYFSEVKVLRALTYYHLMMTYGTCPLVLETIDPGDKEGLLKGDATREEIYSAMIADLEDATKNSNFPWEKELSTSEYGHVGQATARTILTYFYLTRGWENNSSDDFAKAKAVAKEIIDNGGYSLEPVLLDAYYKDFCKESIFELTASNAARGLGSFTCSWAVPLTTPPGGDKKYYNGWYKMAVTQKLYDAIEEGDARHYLLANPANGENKEWAPKFLGGDKYDGPKLVVDNEYENVFGLPVYMYAKACSPKEWYDKLHPNDGVGANWVIYRLSDVYLLYAEACIKTGDEANARTYINKVRQRARNAWTAYLPAGNPDIPTHVEGKPADLDASVSGDALLAALKNERRIELFAEMKRMIDLRRWSLGGAKDLENDVSVNGSWNSKYKWFPKPQDQVDLSEGNVIQNPGY